MKTPKQFSITSLRAALDQEELWKIDSKKMMERNNARADKIRPVAFIGVVMSISGTIAKFAVDFSFLNNPAHESLAASITNFLFIVGFLTTFSAIIAINVLWRISTRVNRWDRAHWIRTWGVPTAPIIKYQHDKNEPGYLIATEFRGHENQFIGRIPPNDSIAESLNFSKPDSREND